MKTKQQTQKSEMAIDHNAYDYIMEVLSMTRPSTTASKEEMVEYLTRLDIKERIEARVKRL